MQTLSALSDSFSISGQRTYDLILINQMGFEVLVFGLERRNYFDGGVYILYHILYISIYHNL